MNRTITVPVPASRPSGLAALVADLFRATPLGILLAAIRRN